MHPQPSLAPSPEAVPAHFASRILGQAGNATLPQGFLKRLARDLDYDAGTSDAPCLSLPIIFRLLAMASGLAEAWQCQ